MEPNGVVFYKGKSRFDGAPLVGILVGLNRASQNRKTGGMVQSYILRSRIDPRQAVSTGQDQSICGTCKHKGSSCYVFVGRGPLIVYRAYKRGKYPTVDLEEASRLLTGRNLRIGTYGDPVVIPSMVWETLLQNTMGHTGYTHFWGANPLYRAYLMASCDTAQETCTARALGWRTFSVLAHGETPPKQAYLCPASREAGYKLTCEQCLACNGGTKRTRSIYIPVHGLARNQKAFQRLIHIEGVHNGPLSM